MSSALRAPVLAEDPTDRGTTTVGETVEPGHESLVGFRFGCGRVSARHPGLETRSVWLLSPTGRRSAQRPARRSWTGRTSGPRAKPLQVAVSTCLLPQGTATIRLRSHGSGRHREWRRRLASIARRRGSRVRVHPTRDHIELLAQARMVGVGADGRLRGAGDWLTALHQALFPWSPGRVEPAAAHGLAFDGRAALPPLSVVPCSGARALVTLVTSRFPIVQNAFDLRRVLAEHRRRIRRSSLRAPRRCACGPVPPSTCRVLGRAANVTTSRRSGSLASSTIRRPSPRRLWSPRNEGCPSAPEARRSPPRGLPARGFAGRGRGRRPCGRRVPRTRTRRRVPAAARPAASRVARPYAARRGNEWRPERLERFPASERARQLVAGVPEPIRPCHLRDREGGGVLLTARPLATCRYGVRPDGRRIIIKCQEARRIVEGLRTRAARRKSCCRS